MASESKVHNDHLKEPGSSRSFTSEELSKLNERHNAHVAYRGKVYDVSTFVARHPGGVDQIMLGAGRDITTVFECYHSKEIKKILDGFYVGELVDNEFPVWPESGEFYQTLKNRVDTYFKANGLDPKIHWGYFFQCFFFISMTIICGFLTFIFSSSWIGGIFFTVAWGFFSAQIANMCHDSSHFCITHYPFVWKLIGSCHDFLLGASIYMWHHQHTIGHHIYTNIIGVDPDITPINHDIPDIRRIMKSQKWLPFYYFQHLYMPVLYGLLGLKTKCTDIYTYFTMRMGSTLRVNPLSTSQKVIFFGGKIAHFIVRFGIPTIYYPFSTVVFLNMVGEAVASYWLVFMFETSHDNGEVEWFKPDENNVMKRDWAEMQVVSSQDWDCDSWYWSIFSGRINHQVAHHLFPAVIPAYYPVITPIIRKTCKDFGIQYNHLDSAWTAMGNHLKHLRTLGSGKDAANDKKSE